MTGLNPRISRSNTPAVSTTTERSVSMAYMLHSVAAISVMACVVFENPQLCKTATCNYQVLVMNKEILMYRMLRGIPVFDGVSKITNARKLFPKEYHADIFRIEVIISLAKFSMGLYLHLNPYFDEEYPHIPRTAFFIWVCAMQDLQIAVSGKSIPEFFAPLVNKIERCRVHLIQPLSFRSRIAAIRAAAQAALAPSSQSDSRCRRVYNGMWSVMTTCVNAVKGGFSCKRKPVNGRSSDS